MNQIEKSLMHALFKHLHHNIDQVIDFGMIEKVNQEISKKLPGILLVGPGDDAGAFELPGTKQWLVVKLESHCSPAVPRPYDAAATGAGGAMRDTVAMGAMPIVLLDFVGTCSLEEKVLVGPCGFDGECICGKCEEMLNQKRLNLMMKGIQKMCRTMDVFLIGGGLSTSLQGIVPAVVVAVIGIRVVEKPLTKPAKNPGDKLIIIGETNNDGNDTLYRAGMTKEMRPAIALFKEERTTREATLAAFLTGKVKSCSDLGAAGVGAAVCESARYGNLGAKVDLALVPIKKGVEGKITPEEILICETQARMMIQVASENVKEVMKAIRSKNGIASVIGKITDKNKVIFKYRNKTIATIPNAPSKEILKQL